MSSHMGTQAQKTAAAHARAARWPSVNLNYELSDNEQLEASLMAAAWPHVLIQTQMTTVDIQVA